MRLTKRVIARVILLAIFISVGIWLLYEPGVEAAASTMRKATVGASNINASWQRSNSNLVTDEDGDQWRCENPEASNPDEMDCALASQPQQTGTLELNHHMSVRMLRGNG